jgi:hypothetical protein
MLHGAQLRRIGKQLIIKLVIFMNDNLLVVKYAYDGINPDDTLKRHTTCRRVELDLYVCHRALYIGSH